MKGKMTPVLVLGMVLLLAALGVGIYSGVQSYLGREKSQEILLELNGFLPPKTQGVPELYTNSTMPVLELHGTDYVAVVEVPTFGVELPVGDSWEEKKLSETPARFWGSAYDHTLVIGGADTSGQFEFCDQIEHGASVMITDMTGAQFHYTVSRIDRGSHADSQWLTEEQWDLTLFCHDSYAMEYVAVRCLFSGNLPE